MNYRVLHDAPGSLAEVARFDDNDELIEIVQARLSPDIAETIADRLNKQEQNQHAQ